LGHSEKSALKLGMSAIPLGADIRDILRRDGRSGTRLKDRMVKVQTTLVASPGFGPIFGRLAIGGFEPPQPNKPKNQVLTGFLTRGRDLAGRVIAVSANLAPRLTPIQSP
jgi:hypothetical protein